NDKRKIKSEAYGKGIFIKDNGGKIAEAERQCLNSVIQGTAADITKLAMKEIGNNEELKELGYQMLLPVHDEDIAEAPEHNADRAGKEVDDIVMQDVKCNLDV